MLFDKQIEKAETKDQETRIRVLLKIERGEPLTAEEFYIAIKMGADVTGCHIIRDVNLYTLEKDQVVLILVEEMHDQTGTWRYDFDLGTVEQVFDQFYLVWLEKMNRHVTVYPHQIMVDVPQKKGELECMPITRDGKKIFNRQEDIILPEKPVANPWKGAFFAIAAGFVLLTGLCLFH